jgi:DNA-directed RNA polymerase subunit beta
MTKQAATVLNFTQRKRIRKTFGRLESATELPNLIEVQKKSYDQFLQIGIAPRERKDTGLQAVLKSVFPIQDFTETATLEFVCYEFDEPKYDVEECRQRDANFAAPMRATLRLITWVVDEDTGAREIKDIKEQDVYMGDIPLMTENGTFVINGTERVIVSQMHRSPGVFFDHDQGKSHSSGKLLYNARIIPYRGSWLDFEFDAKDIVFTRIDRRRKLPVTSLLRALDMTTEEILSTFYNTYLYKKVSGKKGGWAAPFNPDRYRGVKLTRDLIDAKDGTVVAKEGEKLTPRKAKQLIADGLKDIVIEPEEILGSFFARNLVNKDGEVLADAGAEITEAQFNILADAGIKELPVLDIDHINVGPYMRHTLTVDKNATKTDALMDIYKVMRPGEPTTPEAAEVLFKSLFFEQERYDLSPVGRVKMNARLDLELPEEQGTLTKQDIIETIKILVRLKDGFGVIDDIDHLGNRRVRSVGELMENQYRIGLLRMERSIIERMSSVDIDTVMPHDLVNAKPVAAAVREFFGSSQLSQFMDQTNPLSEITHKRRLSALGPGGLTRERAGFEVRDVHPTHYGRICPIETPEGPNIGLINSMATYARVNKYGFIETPYRKVINKKVTDEVIYLSAIQEGKYTIAQANATLDKDGCFSDDLVPSRQAGEFAMSIPDSIDYIDVAPKQLVSVAAAMIPFLENDDANRALMGSNMQRQAVPLIRSEAPLVGTGMEAVVARDSGAAITARHAGVVDQVDGSRIVIRGSGEGADGSAPGVDIYNLQKFQRSNQNTCINQRPLVKVGDVLQKGDIIADGPSTDMGELALGRNTLVAFMPWNGYNYEDSILISERIVSDDVFTSIHIEEFEVMARDTKLGPEEITRDIPNVGEEALRSLDEIGVTHIGAEVKAGDILVGKVTPKSESPMTPEEKLLRAIFGEKASDVRDSSLRVPPGVAGTVVGVRIFSRRGIEKDERALAIEQAEIQKLAKDRNDEKAIIEGFVYGRLRELLEGKEAASGPKGFKKAKLTAAHFEQYSRGQWWQFAVENDKLMNQVEALKAQLEEAVTRIEKRFADKVEKVQGGDDLSPGVLKMVKVFLAVKRKLAPGDKMAGRHGNKGVVSKIIPVEDMPYLEDGTPVDIVLNPLGVPSRMNVGQILETHLGWAAAGIGKQIAGAVEVYQNKGKSEDLRKKLMEVYDEPHFADAIGKMSDDELMELGTNTSHGVPFATPVFDGATEKDIEYWLKRAGLPTSGQMPLYDGRTGDRFERDVTVGYIYMLKLHHLVDDKIHARSIGPYSLVTQQPLGGKSQFGGQRFGEMECWALQAYGAAFTLQEILTVKSDDVAGRSKVYESIVRGDHSFESGIPESFHVMVKELRSLCLNVELKENEA